MQPGASVTHKGAVGNQPIVKFALAEGEALALRVLELARAFIAVEMDDSVATNKPDGKRDWNNPK